MWLPTMVALLVLAMTELPWAAIAVTSSSFPPPDTCPRSTDISNPCRFKDGAEFVNQVGKVFPLFDDSGNPIANVTVGLTSSPSDSAFQLTVDFGGGTFTPIPQKTMIQYSFFESLNEVGHGITPYLASDQGKQCNATKNGLPYFIQWKGPKDYVFGYTVTANAPLSFTDTAAYWLAPFSDSSFPMWYNVPTGAMCCHQDQKAQGTGGKGTVLAVRIYNQATVGSGVYDSANPKSCNDQLPVALGYFDFTMDCTCPNQPGGDTPPPFRARSPPPPPPSPSPPPPDSCPRPTDTSNPCRFKDGAEFVNQVGKVFPLFDDSGNPIANVTVGLTGSPSDSAFQLTVDFGGGTFTPIPQKTMIQYSFFESLNEVGHGITPYLASDQGKQCNATKNGLPYFIQWKGPKDYVFGYTVTANAPLSFTDTAAYWLAPFSDSSFPMWYNVPTGAMCCHQDQKAQGTGGKGTVLAVRIYNQATVGSGVYDSANPKSCNDQLPVALGYFDFTMDCTCPNQPGGDTPPPFRARSPPPPPPSPSPPPPDSCPRPTDTSNPCRFKDGAEFVNQVGKVFPLFDDSGNPIANVTVGLTGSPSDSAFQLTVDFGGGTFTPIPQKTMIQYSFFESLNEVGHGITPYLASDQGKQCNATKNGLPYFIQWKGPKDYVFGYTVAANAPLSFTDTAAYWLAPFSDSSFPRWYNVPTGAMCCHQDQKAQGTGGKGTVLAVRIYNQATVGSGVYDSANPKSCNDQLPVALGYFDFTMDCTCPNQPGGDTPPPFRARSPPPPPPSPSPPPPDSCPRPTDTSNPCRFKDGAEFVNQVGKVFPLFDDSGNPIANVTVGLTGSPSDSAFQLTVDFGGGTFTPIPQKTMIQYSFFESLNEVGHGITPYLASDQGKQCNATKNGLPYFIQWKGPKDYVFGYTVTANAPLSFTDTAAYWLAPFSDSSFPMWYNVPTGAMCCHQDQKAQGTGGKGTVLAVRIYNQATVGSGVYDSANPKSCNDQLPVALGYFDFTMDCTCPNQPGGDTPPPFRARSPPPPPPSPSPPPPDSCPRPTDTSNPCRFKDGAEFVNQVGKVFPLFDDSGNPIANVTVGLTGSPSDSAFQLTVDFGGGTFTPIPQKTMIQYSFFESLNEVGHGITPYLASDQGKQCNATKNGLPYFIQWKGPKDYVFGYTVTANAPLSFTDTAAYWLAPFSDSSFPMWYNVPTGAMCCHQDQKAQGTGGKGTVLAVRIYNQATVGSGVYDSANPKSCNDQLPVALGYFDFTMDCTCPNQPGGDTPPPFRARSPPPPPPSPSPPSPPPPYSCRPLRPQDKTPPCRFFDPITSSTTATSVSKSFPLVGGGSVSASLTLSGAVTPKNTFFTLKISFVGFTPTANTKISYLFFESLYEPGHGFYPFFNSTAATSCSANYGSTVSYNLVYNVTNPVYGYTSNTVAAAYDTAAKSVTIKAPFADKSFSPWNGASGPEMCCHQDSKGGTTVLSLRIFNKGNNGYGDCSSTDLLALADGVLTFKMDCSCTGPSGRRLLLA